MEEVRIYALGPPRISIAGVDIRLHRRKAMALLVYLALEPRAHGRESLATFLWPTRDRGHALASLRQCLMELQHAIGPEVLIVTGDTVSLRERAETWLDVRELETAAAGNAPERWMEAAALWRGGFLEGFTLADSAPFDDWQSLQTERVYVCYVSILHRIIGALEAAGNTDGVLQWARILQLADPLDEKVHRSLMQSFEARGEHRAALEQYERCARLVADELGAEPEAETVALYRTIRSRCERNKRDQDRFDVPAVSPKSSAQTHRPGYTTTRSRRRVILVTVAVLLAAALSAAVLWGRVERVERSPRGSGTDTATVVAVLEFTGLGNDRHTAEWTARGLSELLATKLAAEERAEPVSRQRPETYGRPPPTVRRIGERIEASFWLEGAVLSASGSLTVVARLVETESGTYVWRSQYHREEGEDMILFLDSTADSIAAAALETITTAEQEPESYGGGQP